MTKIDDLLRAAQDCYTQAKVTINLATKHALTQMGDDYTREAEDLRYARGIVQAAFPKTGSKIG